MKRMGRKGTESSELRGVVQEMVDQGGEAPDALPEGDAKRLLHELQVHQTELELQNEELKVARIEVEEGLARYSELFDFAPIGYAILTTGGAITEVNHTGARLLGQPRALLEGKLFAGFVAPISTKDFSDLLRLAVTSDRREECDVQLDPRAGGSLHLHLSASGIPGNDPMILLAFQDITAKKVKEENLEKAEDALREANRRKDEFMAALSHELRNPLMPIRSCLYLLSRVEPGGEQARKALTILERQTTHLTRLVDDLLDITRIARGKIQLRREHVELGGLLRSTVEDHRASFESSGVSLEADLGDEKLWIWADPARVAQVLGNLLSNAEKFTQRGGTVKVSVERRGEKAQVRICDTGVGIAPDVLAHLFEPFAQAPQTIDRSRGGLGLGLATAKGLVELHEGAIRVSSEGPGHGTTIVVSLPIEPAPGDATSDGSRASSSSRKILVIEDSRDGADGLRQALVLAGHEAEVAYDGPSGIAKAQLFRPDVVFCDIGLPGMSGYDVARALRSDRELRGTYLVALTGYARPEDHDRAVDAGFDQHVAKPPSVENLFAVIARARSPRDSKLQVLP